MLPITKTTAMVLFRATMLSYWLKHCIFRVTDLSVNFTPHSVNVRGASKEVFPSKMQSETMQVQLRLFANHEKYYLIRLIIFGTITKLLLVYQDPYQKDYSHVRAQAIRPPNIIYSLKESIYVINPFVCNNFNLKSSNSRECG